MKACQLCGAKSWGPVARIEEIAGAYSPCFVLTGLEAVAYARCDNCSAVAQKVLIDAEEPSDSAVNPAVSLQDLSEVNPFRIASSVLKAALPVPETRLERLVRALCRSGDKFATVTDLVEYARRIERAMDSDPAAETCWASLQWPTREDFMSWMLPGLDQARRGLLEVDGLSTIFNINRLAKHFADWLEGKTLCWDKTCVKYRNSQGGCEVCGAYE